MIPPPAFAAPARARRVTTALVALAVLSTASFADAAGGGTGPKGEGGRGGPGPGSASGGSGGGSEGAFGGENGDINPDRATSSPSTAKFWEIGAIGEVHRLLVQEDLNGGGDRGAAADKVVNFYELYGALALTRYDSVKLRWGLYQRFVADQGETGIRSDDVWLTYTRYVPLPSKVDLRITPGILLPTSFTAQKESLILEPTLSVDINRRWDDLLLGLRPLATWYFVKYRQLEGGAPNPKARVGVTAYAEYNFPLHRPLTFGLSLSVAERWYYNTENVSDPNVARYGAVADSIFPSQPTQQSYGGQVYARYLLPEVYGFRADVTLAYGQGDPTLGYTSALHDGVARGYLFWRQSSEIYAILAARY